MGTNNLPKIWEEFLELKTGLPFVELSVERIIDSRYHLNSVSKHNHYEIVYVQNGEAIFEINGEQVKVGKKDFLIINPLTSHKLIINENESCSFITLYFNFKKTDAVVSLDDFLYNVNKKGYGAFMRLNSVYKNEIVSALNRITKEMNSKKSDSEFLSSLIVMEIFVWFSRALKNEWENSVNRNTEKQIEIMESSKAYIEENYNKEVSLNDIANNVYLSPSHFARVFKNYFNISPIQYLLSLRIKKAKKLLEESDLKINEISDKVGFSAQQRFNDIFNKHEGMSPSEYRKRSKKQDCS